MTSLVIMRGLPGSGKSTKAREWVLVDPDHRAEVNRDALRFMINGMPVGTGPTEKMVTAIAHNAIRDLLKAGTSVVVSDTNLASRYVRDLMRIGIGSGAEIEFWDLTDVDLRTCLDRNSKRTDKDPVPADVITGMYNRYVRGKGYPLPVPAEDSARRDPDLYTPVPGRPSLLIVDIDGTVAKIRPGGRSPYDYTRVSEDVPNRPVIDVVRAMVLDGWRLGHMSGREGTEQCRADTEAWVESNVRIRPDFIDMRAAGDTRNDAVVKREMFDNRVRGKYGDVVVLDDRDRVVRMWREELGLTVLQVAYGAF